MANFTPLSAAIGGALIGLSAVLLMLLTGRIAGVSGIFGGLLNPDSSDKGWRIAFIAGLILAPLLAGRDRSCDADPAIAFQLDRHHRRPACWSASARGSAAAAPPATASAAWRGCRFARSRPPPSSC